MAFSPQYRAEVEEKLSAVVPIRTKPMFGGVGIYSNELFFALIAEDKLYFKVDETNRGDFEAAGKGPFFPYDSPTPMGYWELPEELLDQPEALGVWVDKALGVAERKKRPRRR
jgi:DNA transformation protein and related proteins